MNDTWTWTTERGLTVDRRSGLGGGGKREKKLGHCNKINNKNKEVLLSDEK